MLCTRPSASRARGEAKPGMATAHMGHLHRKRGFTTSDEALRKGMSLKDVPVWSEHGKTYRMSSAVLTTINISGST